MSTPLVARRAVAAVGALLLTTSAAGQGIGVQRSANSSAAERTAPRTPWGHPDLQGTWTSEPEFGVPFERAREFGTRQLLTDQEYADRLARSKKQASSALDEIDV